ncbi:MAG: hypothetical protein ACK56F_09500, partial [bacterium]
QQSPKRRAVDEHFVRWLAVRVHRAAGCSGPLRLARASAHALDRHRAPRSVGANDLDLRRQGDSRGPGERAVPLANLRVPVTGGFIGHKRTQTSEMSGRRDTPDSRDGVAGLDRPLALCN